MGRVVADDVHEPRQQPCNIMSRSMVKADCMSAPGAVAGAQQEHEQLQKQLHEPWQ